MNVVMGYKDLQSPLAMPPREGNAYMIDLMAMIRTASPVPDTYVNLAKMLFSKLPAGYSRIDIVADIQIKFVERKKGVFQAKYLLVPHLQKSQETSMTF